MLETGLALGLVRRPDAVPHRHRDHVRLMVLMDDHAQPVVEREGLIGNVDRLHELRNRRGLTCLCLGERGTGGDQRGRRGKRKGKAVKTGHGRSSRKTGERAEEHTSELTSLMRISYA